MQILRKITLKNVAGRIDIEKVLAAPDRRIHLMKVYGLTHKAIFGQTDIGAYVKFSGSFRAVNMETGEMFESGALILPGIAQDLLLGALNNNDVESVTFGFDISVKYSPESVAKYEYDVSSMLAPTADDPLERLGAALGITVQLVLEHAHNIHKSVHVEDETVPAVGQEIVPDVKHAVNTKPKIVK